MSFIKENKILFEKGQDEFLYNKDGDAYIDMNCVHNVHGYDKISLKNAPYDPMSISGTIWSNSDKLINDSDEILKSESNNDIKYTKYTNSTLESIAMAWKVAKKYSSSISSAQSSKKSVKNKILILNNGFALNLFYNNNIINFENSKQQFKSTNLFYSEMDSSIVIDIPNYYNVDYADHNNDEIKDWLSLFVKTYSSKICLASLENTFTFFDKPHCPHSEIIDHLISACNKHNILTIINEPFTSVCRSGKFFSYQKLNNKPDMISISSAIANGIVKISNLSFFDKLYNFILEKNIKSYLNHTHHDIDVIFSFVSSYVVHQSISLASSSNLNSKSFALEVIGKNWFNVIDNDLISNRLCDGSVISFEINADENVFNEILNEIFLNKIMVGSIEKTIFIIPPMCMKLESFRSNLDLIDLSIKKHIKKINNIIK